MITRIIWLRGLEAANAHAFSRCIYIHGTPEEKTIGRPASYGCIRMKSRDVAELYAQLPVGALVEIVNDRLPKIPKAPRGAVFTHNTPKPAPPIEPESKPEPERVAVAEEPAPPAEKPVEQPRRAARKNLKEQPRFGRGA